MQAGGPGGLITNGSGSFRGRIDGQPGPMGGAGSMGGSSNPQGIGMQYVSGTGRMPGDAATAATWGTNGARLGGAFGGVPGSFLGRFFGGLIGGQVGNARNGYAMDTNGYNPTISGSIFSGSGSNRGSYSTSGSSTNSDGSSNGGNTGTRGGY